MLYPESIFFKNIVCKMHFYYFCREIGNRNLILWKT